MVNKRTDGSETDTEATAKVSESDGDHDADGFEQIGVLAKRILSRAKARKKTEETNATASSVSFAQASVGDDMASKPIDRTIESASQHYI